MKPATNMLTSIQASINKYQETYFFEDLEMLRAISLNETYGKDNLIDDEKIFDELEILFFHTKSTEGLSEYQHELLKDVLVNCLNKNFTPQKDTRPIHERTDKGKAYLTDSIYNLILSEKPKQLTSKQFSNYIKNLIELRKSLPRTIGKTR